MFQSISWQEFFTTISLIVGAYYTISVLLLYSGELTSIFNQRKSNATKDSIEGDQSESKETKDLMGKVKYITRVNVPHEKSVDAEEISVSESDAPEETINISISDSPETLLIKAADELRQQIKALLIDFPPDSKEEVLLAIRPLLSKFPQLAGTPHQNSVSSFIHDTLCASTSIEFHPNDIKSWWADND